MISNANVDSCKRREKRDSGISTSEGSDRSSELVTKGEEDADNHDDGKSNLMPCGEIFAENTKATN